MGQQAGFRNEAYRSLIAPEIKWSNQRQADRGLIRARRKALERPLVRGERLIKLNDGWFSTKAIEVAYFFDSLLVLSPRLFAVEQLSI